jgi:hypothetical protein
MAAASMSSHFSTSGVAYEAPANRPASTWLVVPQQAKITCPQCGHVAAETMPTDACLYFYECVGCKTLLRPKPGDCCVFCSYADARCPPQVTGTVLPVHAQ